MKERVKNSVLRLFWITLTGGMAIYTIHTSIDTLANKHITDEKSEALDSRIARYEAQIAADSTFIENMKNPKFMERYAREHFHMQREGEMVYLTE